MPISRPIRSKGAISRVKGFCCASAGTYATSSPNEHVAELLAERGVEVDSQLHLALREAYTPELNKRYRPHLKSTNKSYL